MRYASEQADSATVDKFILPFGLNERATRYICFVTGQVANVA